MSETERPHKQTNEDMLAQLPYQLTKGVVATRDGIVFNIGDPRWLCIESDEDEIMSDEDGNVTIPWDAAAKRLRYQEGEPWCWYDPNNLFANMPSNYPPVDISEPMNPLHRLAAIICDDAEDFRVLHHCIEMYGGRT